MAHHEADLSAKWRTQASDDNPAGPLFEGGALAMADIVSDARVATVRCGTICTGSLVAECC